MISVERICERLLDIDWNFPGSTTPRNSTHALHFYPGNFIPQLAAFLVEIVSLPGAMIYDPFCGSGTTGVEAVRLKRSAWQSDNSRAAVQVAGGKMALAEDRAASQGLRRLQKRLGTDFPLRSAEVGRSGEGSAAELRRWIQADTLAQLRYIWRGIETETEGPARSAAELLFTDVLFAAASTGGQSTRGHQRRRHHWGWIADNVRPLRLVWHNALALMMRRLETAIAIAETATGNRMPSVLLREDVRRATFPASGADAVVTSPPYLGMIDYALANRLTYMWMGWSIEEDRSAEIGARYRRERKRALDEYLEAMTLALNSISKALRPGGYAAFVIGASRRFPTALNAFWQLAASILQPIWGPQSRNPSRTRLAERRARMPEEWICILRRA